MHARDFWARVVREHAGLAAVGAPRSAPPAAARPPLTGTFARLVDTPSESLRQTLNRPIIETSGFQ